MVDSEIDVTTRIGLCEMLNRIFKTIWLCAELGLRHLTCLHTYDDSYKFARGIMIDA